MAHESFEDETTAALMNRNFVNIKVDREERPDLDRIYQSAHQLLTRRAGGWPLTMFLSPDDQLPFFAGTYFPNQPRHGMIAFTDLLQRIADLYQQEPEFGGFGHAPKFPQAAILHKALARAFAGHQEDAVFQAIDFSLRQIARGGIQDQVGGGFYRYSVDDQWMIPHFEKMLRDNEQLLQLFVQAWRLTGNTLFSDAVDGIAAWVKREMTSPTGTFYTALDADSEGVEGKFYLWTPAAAAACIDASDYPAFAWRYGLEGPANFEGQWHLHGYHDEQQLCERFAIDIDTCRAQQARARASLLTGRRTRP